MPVKIGPSITIPTDWHLLVDAKHMRKLAKQEGLLNSKDEF